MPISDDDGEPVLQSVTDYHFVDDRNNVISFFVLPFELGKDERVGGTEKAIFLHGKADGGLQKIYKRVIRWKLDLSGEQHEISVLSMEGCWIKLQKPRKSFEGAIRTILIIIYCLHFAKKNPNASWGSLRKHLDKVFSLHEAIPSEGDLRHHLPLIRVMLRRDKALAKSKILHAFLENPKKCRMSLKDMQKVEKYKFIVDWEDMDEELENAVGDEYNDDPELFDSVCAICDNGGEILCCEGSCLRSFHATIEAGAESLCRSLRLSDAEVEAMQTFLCANCQYKQHQCFACGKLGSSDKSSGAAEVFSCVSATCGRFYHPACVARLLHQGNEAKAKDHHKRIAAGEAFTCPIHKCVICKQGENKELEEMQFAICRRCPKGYHKKCLPRKISLRPIEEEHIIQRAWPGLIPNRLLIYCLKHEIEEDLGTPTRNHIIFPDVEKNRSRPLDLKSSIRKLISKRIGMFSGDASSEESDKKIRKETKKGSLTELETHFTKKSEKSSFELGVDPSKKFKAPDGSICFKDVVKPIFPRVDKSSAWKENKGSIRQNSTDSPPSMGLHAVKPKKLKEICSSKPVMALSSPIMKKSSNMSPLLDSESKNKIMNLIRKTSSSITLKDIMKKYNPPATLAYSSRNVDKTITQGKVKASVEAVRTALQKLKNGCSIEDAKAVCEPAILQQIINWKNKLNIYLAPFLHGMRYTSFGRHFTKVDKIKEIVDMIHWYVQNGDMMVDFCCGANDYSLLMRDKLEETGKKCLFKNYDLFQPKNDFNFEQRDWMTVLPQELPDGSQLIMGLNPPFGFKASLANKFIDKALEFKPKLIILIVPRETQRLDVKESCYDLIWEETMRLSGKSFYLPGSVDTNDKQLDQWNLKPPVLWLWSRPDWTPKHMAVAVKQGHTCKVQEEPFINQVETQFSDQWWKDHDFDDDMDISDDDLYAKNDQVKRYAETRTMVTEQQIGTTTPKHYTCHHEEDGDGGPNGYRNMKKRDHENPGREYKVKQARTRDQHHISWPHTGVMLNAEMFSLSGGTTRSLREGGLSDASETGNEEVLQPSQHGFSGSGLEFGTGHGGAPLIGFPGDLNYSFGLSSETVYSSCPNASMTQQYGTCLNELNYSGQGLGSVNQLSSSFGVFRPPVVYPNTHVTQQYTLTPQLPQMGGSILATHGPWSDVQYPLPHQSSSGWNGK